MQRLNLPPISVRIREGSKGNQLIFDEFRRKFVKLTPEEWVRQHFLHLMTFHLGYPASLIVVEASVIYNGMKKRFDLLAYNADGKPVAVVECKAPTVEITQRVFDQVAMYNKTLGVSYVMVTNGLNHYACHIDHSGKTFRFLDDIPSYEEVTNPRITIPES
ncbi:MAG: type I restriction enzyme HsdR N-terminal domain-containing protein [Bacteroidales bacterium]|nr:type I restriction enzyme HsdR N-terminal domain-containing protein [Bacteroidales bacterium]HNW72415.1 type I restriction enzyme HsdR N-terminal domain-containing protein [Bacteroidales bacterium]HPS49460.1 type I restriction enzyme HsdR N-terminal domain-containing protein [Bacteroidales bacterium]